MPQLEILDRNGEPHRLGARAGDTVMEVLRDAGLPIEAVCGGCCVCATCHVYIAPEWFERLAPPGPGESALLEGCVHYRRGASRLGCQIALREADEGLALQLAPEE